YAVDLLLDRPTYRRFAFAVLVWVAMLFGGHPETVSHTTFLCGLYLVWVVLIEKHAERLTWPFVRDRFAAVIGAVIVAALIALPLRGVGEGRFREREFFFVIATVLVLGVILAWPGISTGFHALFKLAANARLRLFLAWLLSIQLAAILEIIRRERAWHFLGG